MNFKSERKMKHLVLDYQPDLKISNQEMLKN